VGSARLLEYYYCGTSFRASGELTGSIDNYGDVSGVY